MAGSLVRRKWLQDLFFRNCAIEPNGAALTGAVAARLPIFPHLVTGSPGQEIGGTLFFDLAVENIPARGQHQQIFQAGQGKPPVVNQRVDPLDLGDLEFGIKAVIGAVFPNRFEKSLFLVFPDTFLGKIDQSGDIVDEVQLILM